MSDVKWPTVPQTPPHKDCACKMCECWKSEINMLELCRAAHDAEMAERDARIAELEAKLNNIQLFDCGHAAQITDGEKWDGCPICAMMEGTAQRIADLEAKLKAIEVDDGCIKICQEIALKDEEIRKLKAKRKAMMQRCSEENLEDIAANTATNFRLGHCTHTHAIATAIRKLIEGEQ